MYWREDNEPEGLSEEQRWERRLCGTYADNLLREKFGMEILPIDEGRVCSDGRRTPTVRKKLAHMLDSPYDFKVHHDTWEKIAPKYAIAPEFRMDGTKEVSKYSYSNRETVAMDNRYDAYRNIKELNPGETIYVWLHLDEYDYQCIHRKEKNASTRYSGNSYREWDDHLIFPADSQEDIEKSVYQAKLFDYVSKHIEDVLTATCDMDVKRLLGQEAQTRRIDSHELKNESKFTDETLTEKIRLAASQMRFLRRTIKELLEFRGHLRRAGGHQGFIEEAMNKTGKWIQHNAPKFVLQDSNKQLKELADLCLKGSPQGMLS